MTSMNGSVVFKVLSSRKESYAAGKAMRRRVARESHADCPAPAERDPLAILAVGDKARIPKLLPIRYERMRQSPFSFLRGAAAVMAADLAGSPEIGAHVQACGDCHLKNFGALVSPEGRLLFDINDFDETLPGIDFTVDLKRLVASIALVALELGASGKTARALAQGAAQSYRIFIHKLGKMPPLEVWSKHMDIDREARHIEPWNLRDKFLNALHKTRKNLEADKNYPCRTRQNRIKDRPPLIYHPQSRLDGTHDVDLEAAFDLYKDSLLPERRGLVERYEFHDTAFKVVGVGSVGTYCAIGLFLTKDAEPLFLQVKEARPSVLGRIAAAPREPGERGRHVVDGQRAMQAASDVFLGWTRDERTGLALYVRQLKHRRVDDIFDEVFAQIGAGLQMTALDAFSRLCARTLARAHARTGDPALLAGYMGKSEVLDDALASFALSYARLTAHDHARLDAAIDPATGLPPR